MRTLSWLLLFAACSPKAPHEVTFADGHLVTTVPGAWPQTPRENALSSGSRQVFLAEDEGACLVFLIPAPNHDAEVVIGNYIATRMKGISATTSDPVTVETSLGSMKGQRFAGALPSAMAKTAGTSSTEVYGLKVTDTVIIFDATTFAASGDSSLHAQCQSAAKVLKQK